MINLNRLLFVFLILVSCEKSDVEADYIHLIKYPIEMQAFVMDFSRFHKAWDNQETFYEAWPLGQLWYDERNERVCQVYNSRNSHVDLYRGKVLFRNKEEKGKWSKPSLVASWEIDSVSKRCHGAGVCQNGDYIALVIHEEKEGPYGNTYLYRSKDYGATWVNEGAIVIDGSLVYVSECSCVFKTSSNRILSFASIGLGKKTACVIYSDDNGLSWRKSLMPEGMGFLEGTFVQMDNNAIYCIARQKDEYCYPNSPQMSFSYDNGESWIYLGDTGLHSTDAPVAQLRVGNHVYLLYGDRWPDSRGNLTLFFNWLSLQDYERMNFLESEVSIADIRCSYPDFSYPALVETPNTIQGTFYCSGDNNVGIYEMMATKPEL